MLHTAFKREEPSSFPIQIIAFFWFLLSFKQDFTFQPEMFENYMPRTGSEPVTSRFLRKHKRLFKFTL